MDKLTNNQVAKKLIEIEQGLEGIYFQEGNEDIGNILLQVKALTRDLQSSENRRNDKYGQFTNQIVTYYTIICNYSVKETREWMYKYCGVWISDKQIRNILQEAGVYQGRKHK